MSLKYIKPFDGLRGFGALMILIYHWPFDLIHIDHGWEFMQMFFVMSGYLITRVLIEDKEKYPFTKYALLFYKKRVLRLFPLYFVYLAFAFLITYLFANYPIIKYLTGDLYRNAIYLFTYTYNFSSIVNFFKSIDYTASPLTIHLWTLSLEEQFYLVFPFLIYFLNKRNLQIFVVSAIILAPILRVLSYQWYMQINPKDVVWVAQNITRLPYLQMDSLAFGAALAIFNFDRIKFPIRWFTVVTLLVIGIYLSNMAFVKFVEGTSFYEITFARKATEYWITHNYLFSYIFTLVNFWCMITLLCLVRGHRFRGILENKVLVFLGKHSYGVYLMHLPLLFVYVTFIVKKIGNDRVNNNPFLELFLFSIFFIMIFGLAHLSFKYFESYFLKFKN
jgi:peptidoglycan/LPS O-acetylase OafA/YrhL